MKIKEKFKSLGKRNIILISISAIVLLLLGIVIGIKEYKGYVSTHYPSGAKVGDVIVEKLTLEEAKKEVSKRYNIDSDGIKILQDGKEVGTIEVENPYNIEDIYKKMSVKNKKQKVNEIKVDMDKVNNEIKELKYTETLEEGKNAEIVRDNEEGFKISDSVDSKVINSDKVKAEIIKDIENKKYGDSIDVNDFAENTIKIKSDNKELNDKLNKLNELAKKDLSLKLKDGVSVEIPRRNIALSVQEDGTVDNEYYIKWLNEINQEYATMSDTVEFKTSNGNTINYPNNGNYGWSMEVYSTSEKIANAVINQDSGATIIAETTGNTSQDGKDVVSGDYVEINLDSQHMWVYKNNSVVVSTPVITGLLGKATTPAGIYKVAYKETPSVLRGTGFSGKKYETPVNYWIPFNGDIGIHDSSWQADGSYGGDSYKTVGSNGCVNTPPSIMKKVFDNVSQGETVVVYGSIYD